MDNILLPIDDIIKNDLSINEYLLLYNFANSKVISGIINTSVDELVGLEKKGFIKIFKNRACLREKASVFFTQTDDHFVTWLNTYPVSVTKRNGSKRALSPSKADTVLGKLLKSKWNQVFKKDIDAQLMAIKVLELEIADKKKSGDLEYMVEATRWLNQGYHEKYSYLLDEDTGVNHYENEDYL
jgi:hypothetical protein